MRRNGWRSFPTGPMQQRAVSSETRPGSTEGKLGVVRKWMLWQAPTCCIEDKQKDTELRNIKGTKGSNRARDLHSSLLTNPKTLCVVIRGTRQKTTQKGDPGQDFCVGTSAHLLEVPVHLPSLQDRCLAHAGASNQMVGKSDVFKNCYISAPVAVMHFPTATVTNDLTAPRKGQLSNPTSHLLEYEAGKDKGKCLCLV